jgi:hypothetical protein
MAMKVQGGRMVPSQSTGRNFTDVEAAIQLGIHLQDKIQKLRFQPGGRDKNLDLAMQRAREATQALGNFLAGE